MEEEEEEEKRAGELQQLQTCPALKDKRDWSVAFLFEERGL